MKTQQKLGYYGDGAMETLPAWLLEDLEKLRREQKQGRAQLFLELPIPEPVRRHEADADDAEEPIVIPMR